MRINGIQSRRRSAFTLIELLTVIGIITVLVALVGGAVFRVMASQSLKRTESRVKTVQTGLELQWRAVIDDAKEDFKTGKVPASLVSAAGNDRDRAYVLWIKMRLKQEFPQSFAEVQSWNLGSYMPVKQFYLQELTGATSTGDPRESAVLLYLALSQSRRGSAFNTDDVGSGATATIVVGNKQFRVFVDSWGNPITFERWTTDAAILTELTSDYVPTAQTYKDLQDPTGKLQGWNAGNFATWLHPFTNQNRGPVVRSWGPDKTVSTNDDILAFRLMKEGQRGN